MGNTGRRNQLGRVAKWGGLKAKPIQKTLLFLFYQRCFCFHHLFFPMTIALQSNRAATAPQGPMTQIQSRARTRAAAKLVFAHVTIQATPKAHRQCALARLHTAVKKYTYTTRIMKHAIRSCLKYSAAPA
jgi:hypothetical protein